MELVSTVGGREVRGRIVETEAYIGPHDDASHAAARIGRTPRNDMMYGEPGVAYVYHIYGVHWCLNAVTDEQGFPAAVLIRALQPLRGLPLMKRRRGVDPDAQDRVLASGPGKLAQAFSITGQLNGHQLDRAPLWIETGEPLSEREIVAGPRIGITRAVDLPLRFHERGSPWISRR
jgi:DNA-3-methyladenine glycosylase